MCAKLLHIGPQLKNFTLKCCFLTWCKASENVDCYPKTGKQLFWLKTGGNVFFDLKFFSHFPLAKSKTILPIWGACRKMFKP